MKKEIYEVKSERVIFSYIPIDCKSEARQGTIKFSFLIRMCEKRL